MLTSDTPPPQRATRSDWSPGVAPEILSARQEALRNPKPAAPIPTPEPASNERLDVQSSHGTAILNNPDGRVGFSYTPAKPCGEHADSFSFAYECEGRLWHSVVTIRTKCGDRVVPMSPEDYYALPGMGKNGPGPCQEIAQARAKERAEQYAASGSTR